ncbi:MAG: caspase family protein [Bacteroidota bacterium]|jgi:hypothetical protein
MKKHFILIALMIPMILIGQKKQSDTQGWAVIIEKEGYTELGWSKEHNLPTDYLMTNKLKSTFEYFNWNNNNIKIIHEECNQQIFKEAINWLAQHADSNDIVFLYYDGHGKYLREVIKFNDLFDGLWNNIKSRNKVLVLSCCHAGEFIEKITPDITNSICIGGVASDEILWKGIWHERLPIIGSVFTYYFLESLINPIADKDKNGFVSIKEALNYSELKQREYMQKTLWCNENFKNDSLVNMKEVPHVIVKDKSGTDVYLNLKYYNK